MLFLGGVSLRSRGVMLRIRGVSLHSRGVDFVQRGVSHYVLKGSWTMPKIRFLNFEFLHYPALRAPLLQKGNFTNPYNATFIRRL